MPTKIESPCRLRLAAGTPLAVDPTTGALTNVQLLAAGREAKGHGIFIDDETLATGAAVIADRGGRLKAYVTHNHGGPCSWASPDMDEAASELNIPGFFSDISIKSHQLVAGAYEFYDAFKKNYAPQYELLVELARKTPDLLGISVEIWGYVVYVAKDGTEYSSEPEDVELLYNGMPALRITDFWAAAFVSDGAATNGLFAKFSALFGGKQLNKRQADLAAALTKFAAEFAAETNTVSPGATNEDSSLSTMKIIADLKAKYGSDPKKFGAAMLIVGMKPDSTMEAVEAEMLAVDLTATRAELTKLATDLATATTTIGALTTERDDWKKKFETLKASGSGKELDLGAPAGGAAATANPWLPESKNLAAQAEITKADPARAAALKAAAEATAKK